MKFYTLKYGNCSIPLNAERASEAVREAREEIKWISETVKDALFEIKEYRDDGRTTVIATCEMKDGQLGKWS